MNNDERRRYFRIDETVGITYQRVTNGELPEQKEESFAPDILTLVSEHDRRIEQLIYEISDENPKIGELIMIFNQKVERIVNQLVLKSGLVNRIAHRVREVNISACGIGFINDESINVGERLRMEITLFPDDSKIQTLARVISCEPTEGGKTYYWRLDFYSMNNAAQERLIQHIVRSQSHQLGGKLA